MSKCLPVTILPRLDVTRDRLQIIVGEGRTLEEIVAIGLPDLASTARANVRITIGDWVVPEQNWRLVRPRAGTPVVIRVLPQGNGLRTVLMIAVTVAALALGQFYAPVLAGAIGVSTGVANALIVGGTVLAGTLLVNALVPFKPPTSTASYTINSGRNSLNPDGPVPLILGTIRMAPPYAALPYTENVDDDQYFNAAYLVGYGPVAISDIRIGDTPITDYADVQFEQREGYPTDAPLSLITQQVVEDQMQVEIANAAIPVVRVAGGDAALLSVSLSFAGGLVNVLSNGKQSAFAVDIKIRARLAGSPTWSDITTLHIARNTTVDFRVDHAWRPDVRGRYEIELTRLTRDTDGSTISSRCDLIAIRAFRPEYPFNMTADRPIALIAVRIKASRQLQGALDTLTCLASSVAPDWDVGTSSWVTRATRNPASLSRLVQQGPQVTYPLADDSLDLAGLADWHSYCDSKSLFYDNVIDSDVKLRDTLSDICTAGRARPLDRGDKQGIVIDRPVDAVTAVISPRNARQMSWNPQYVRFPDAVRVTFNDGSNDYKQAERLIPWIGFDGIIDVTEEWSFPGNTDAGAIWIAARRRMHELTLRPFPYTATQDFEALAVEPGDRVMLSHPMIDETAQTAAVKTVRGSMVEIDAPVTMVTGSTYRARIRAADGSSRLVDVVTQPGDRQVIQLTAPLDPPAERENLVLFGRYGQEAVDAIVTRVEPGDDLSAVVTLVNHAPTLDALADAEVPPAWDGRAGGEVTDSRTPLAPIISNIHSGYEIPDDPAGTVTMGFSPGSGDPVPIQAYDLRHRVTGDPTWTEVDNVAATTSVVYAASDSIDLSARAVSFAGIAGNWSDTTTYVVLPATAPGPDIATFLVERLDSGIRRYSWTFVTPPGEVLSDQIGVAIRYKAGSFTSWDDLDPLFTGLQYASPYESTTPDVDGEYTFGIRAFDFDGNPGPAHLFDLTTKPTAPLSFSAFASGDDVDCTIAMAVTLDAGFARVKRSLASADPSTEIDVSGALTAAAGALVNFTDAGALSGGAGPFRYRAYAENASGVLSDPSAEALP